MPGPRESRNPQNPKHDSSPGNPVAAVQPARAEPCSPRGFTGNGQSDWHHIRPKGVWKTRCSSIGMAEDILRRVDRIASAALPGHLGASPCGESYFSFAIRDAAGTVSTLPHIWIDPECSDRQIEDKLKRALKEALHPETFPDDLSVPDLKREASGKR